MSKNTNGITYNRAKTWQIGFFALNNVATNFYMFLMMYVSYYATGVAGIAVVLVSSLLTSMRMFDAITDPIIGFIIDKTNTKFGKFRPMMVIGNIILAISTLVLYKVTHTLPEGNARVLFFTAIYAVYIIGYTFQTACTKAAQACLTNDPSQRPLFTRFDSSYMLLMGSGIAMYTSSYLVPKYGGFTLEAMTEFAVSTVIASAICTVLAVIGLWSKDRAEFFGIGDKGVKVKFRDYISVLKGNRAMQMLIVSAATDKLALQAAGNSSVMVMLYGIIMGNFELYGKMSLITMIPTFIIILVGTKYASRFGSKKALVATTWLSIIGYIALFLVIFLGDPTQISLENFGVMTALWIGISCFANGVKSVSSSIVIPMIADCADYETYLTGRYVPGMMGTLFSFIDKMISSFATTIVGFVIAAIGYTSTMPEVTDVNTPELFWATAFLFMGLPIIGWVCSLVAMKFYPLDDKKMDEVQKKLDEIRKEEAVI